MANERAKAMENGWEVEQDFVIRESDYFDPATFNKCVSFTVVELSFWCQVIITIDFNSYFKLGCVKIDDVSIDAMLSSKLDAI